MSIFFTVALFTIKFTFSLYLFICWTHTHMCMCAHNSLHVRVSRLSTFSNPRTRIRVTIWDRKRRRRKQASKKEIIQQTRLKWLRTLSETNKSRWCRRWVVGKSMLYMHSMRSLNETCNEKKNSNIKNGHPLHISITSSCVCVCLFISSVSSSAYQR